MPGTVAGLALAQQKYGSGKLSLAELIAPAIELARKGFPVEDDIADSLPRAQRAARALAVVGENFPQADGEPLHEGDRLIQLDLADTLEAIAHDGPRAFYQGRIAEKIADAVRAAGGIMTADDLEKLSRHRARRSCAAAIAATTSSRCRRPPSGGVHLIEMLNILEGYDLGKLGRGEQSLHHHDRGDEARLCRPRRVSSAIPTR